MNNALRPCPKRGGFTLMEVAVATIIIGVGLTALMTTLRAGTSTNAASTKMSTALFLAQNIHEWTRKLPYEDIVLVSHATSTTEPASIQELNGRTFQGPRDGNGGIISDLPGWSQTIRMELRESGNLIPTSAKPAPLIPCGAVAISVDVQYRGTPVYLMHYYMFDREIGDLWLP